MSGRYAENTSVGIDRSQAELQKLLTKHGATGFSYAWQGDVARVEWLMGGRHVRMVLPLPTPEEFALTPTRQVRSVAAIRSAHEQAVRARWRALVLVVKAKLEAIATGIVTLDEEFLPHLVLPTGQTVGEVVTPGINVALAGGGQGTLVGDVGRLAIEGPR